MNPGAWISLLQAATWTLLLALQSDDGSQGGSAVPMHEPELAFQSFRLSNLERTSTRARLSLVAQLSGQSKSLPPVEEVVRSGERQSKSWADGVLASARAHDLEWLASYRWLEPGHVDRLIALGQTKIDLNLIRNRHLRLSKDQLDQLLGRTWLGLAEAMTQYRSGDLSAAQQQRLMADASLSEAHALAAGGERALRALVNALQSDDAARVDSALRAVEVNDTIVDLVLQHGSARVRGRMAMQSKHAYTPRQIERMLTDSDRDVVIGVLRRSDIPISAQQFDRGLGSADDAVRFWYTMRLEHVPSREQIEFGLTHPHVPTRRGFAMDKRLVLTQEQVERGLKDPAISNTILARAETQLTAEQWDACTVAPDVSTRFVCVSRTDFTLTHERFEHMLNDWNANVLEFFLNRKGVPAVDLRPFVTHVMRLGATKTLIAMLQSHRVPIDDKSLTDLLETRQDPRVREAVCRRSPIVCLR